jgi:hypothetical protein
VSGAVGCAAAAAAFARADKGTPKYRIFVIATYGKPPLCTGFLSEAAIIVRFFDVLVSKSAKHI